LQILLLPLTLAPANFPHKTRRRACWQASKQRQATRNFVASLPKPKKAMKLKLYSAIAQNKSQSGNQICHNYSTAQRRMLHAAKSSFGCHNDDVEFMS